MKRFARGLWAATALTLVVGLSLGEATAGVYVGGGTVVYKEQGAPPQADNGTAICHAGSGLGIGGGCLPFTPGGFVEVVDVVNGHDVAFQVCIDNNGDGICTDGGRPGTANPCADLVVFSHDDAGLFYNPLGPLPTSMSAGCGATAPWQGYVVFLCEGVHAEKSATGAPGGTPHTHETTAGTIANAGPLPPSGFGDFCGSAGRQEPVSKPYTVI